MGLTRQQRATLKNACVYFLRDPDTLAIRYIGVSTNPTLRRNYHNSCKYTNPKLASWVRKLKASGKRFKMDIVLKGLTVKCAERVEHRLIVLHSQTSDLLQLTYRIEDGVEKRNLGSNSLATYSEAS